MKKTGIKGYVEAAVEIKRQTTMAVLVNDGTMEQDMWVPKSICLDADGEAVEWERYGDNATVTLNIAEWKAKKIGLV